MSYCSSQTENSEKKPTKNIFVLQNKKLYVKWILIGIRVYASRCCCFFLAGAFSYVHTAVGFLLVQIIFFGVCLLFFPPRCIFAKPEKAFLVFSF